MTRLLPLVCLLLAAQLQAAPPRLQRNGPERVTLSLPAELLEPEPVRKRLRSGLTTTFLVELGGERAARIGVRRDLWEERWMIELVDARGRSRRADPRELSIIFAEIRLEVSAPPAARTRVAVTVYPFSEVESDDARSWLSQSTAVDPESPPSAAIDAVIRTAIRARPVYRKLWTVTIEP